VLNNSSFKALLGSGLLLDVMTGHHFLFILHSNWDVSHTWLFFTLKELHALLQLDVHIFFKLNCNLVLYFLCCHFPYDLHALSFPLLLISCCQNTWEQAQASSKTNPSNEGMSLIRSHFGNCCTEYSTFPARFFNLQTIPSPDFGNMYC